MSVTYTNSCFAEQVNNLERLLARQVQLVRKNKIRNIETLVEEAGRALEEITASDAINKLEFAGKHRRLDELYRHLLLAIEERNAETQEKMNEIRRGKNALRRYQQGR